MRLQSSRSFNGNRPTRSSTPPTTRFRHSFRSHGSCSTQIEELGTLNADVNLTSAFASTLAWTQLNDSLKSRWLALSASIARSYDAIDPVQRRRWGRISTSVGTARTVESLVSDVVAAAIATEANLGDPGESLDLLESVDAWNRILALPEVESPNGFFTTRTKRTEVHVDHPDHLEAMARRGGHPRSLLTGTCLTSRLWTGATSNLPTT